MGCAGILKLAFLLHPPRSLNWALNCHKIVPRGDAFHNPRRQLLIERLAKEAVKAVSV